MVLSGPSSGEQWPFMTLYGSTDLKVFRASTHHRVRYSLVPLLSVGGKVLLRRAYRKIPWVGNAGTQAGKDVLSTWIKCPPKLDPEMLRFLKLP